jgi:hypothetical protein
MHHTSSKSHASRPGVELEILSQGYMNYKAKNYTANNDTQQLLRSTRLTNNKTADQSTAPLDPNDIADAALVAAIDARLAAVASCCVNPVTPTNKGTVTNPPPALFDEHIY